MHLSLKHLVPLLLLTASALSVSPIFGGLIPVGGNYLHIISISLILLIYHKNIRLNFINITLTIYILFFSLFNSFYWQYSTFLFSFFFLSAYIVSTQINTVCLHAYTELLTNFILFISIAALAGLFYKLAGGEALLSFKNPDGRINELFLTTFTNTNLTNFIRPSGIYDEPGALSFLACLTVALRETLQMSRTKSNWILFIGLVTTSLAHIIFCIFYLLHVIYVKKKSKKNWCRHPTLIKPQKIFIALSFTAVLLIFSSEIVLIIEHIINRLTVSENTAIAGADRAYRFNNALNYLNPSSFLFGLNGECIVQIASCGEREYLPLGENPLSMLTYYGITLSLPYYAVIFYLLVYSVYRKNLIAFAVFLLLLQRPYVMSFGYSVMIILFVRAITFSRLLKRHAQTSS